MLSSSKSLPLFTQTRDLVASTLDISCAQHGTKITHWNLCCWAFCLQKEPDKEA